MRASAERKRVSRTAELDMVDGPVAKGRTLARDPEKWVPVFGKDHAQDKGVSVAKPTRSMTMPARTCARARRSWLRGVDGSSHDQSRARHHRRLRHLRPAGAGEGAAEEGQEPVGRAV